MASLPHYTSWMRLLPSGQAQIRTVQFAPSSMECDAIARVQTNLKYVRCYDTLTLQLGPQTRYGGMVHTYASIRQCVARLTPDQVKAGCARLLRTCALHGSDSCPPAWMAQTSLEFHTNGRQVTSEWITCGMGIMYRFQYKGYWCGTTPSPGPFRRGWLTAGDDYRVTIPNQVEISSEERIELRPDGALLFEGCC